MANARLAMVGVVAGALIFGAGFLGADVLIWVGGLLVSASVLFPFIAPAKA